MNFKRLMKNNKGISPIFATLILIAIAVIAGVVVYMFTSGTLATMTGGGTAAQEKAAIQGVSYDKASMTLTVYAQNMASTGSIKVTAVLVKDTQGNSVMTMTPATTTMAAGSLATLSGQTMVGVTATVLPAGTYTATVTTAAGGNFVSQSFVVS